MYIYQNQDSLVRGSLTLLAHQLVTVCSSCVAGQVDRQLQELVDQLLLPQEKIDDVVRVCFDLLLSLRQQFPSCIVVPFGSTVAELGILSSDGDLTFFSNPSSDFVDLLRDLRYFSSSTAATIKLFESEYKIMFIPPTPVKLAANSKNFSEENCHTKDLFQGVVKVLRKIEKLRTLSSMTPIPNARCPIIKFVHRETALDCDLSVDQL